MPTKLGNPYGQAMSIMESDAPRARMRLTGRRRGLAIVAVAGWAAVLLFGLLYAGLIQLVGDAGCEAGVGDSNYGTRGWSVVPPGPTCEYTQEMNGFARVDGPTPIMSLWLGGLVLGVFGYLVLVRRARRI